MPAVEVLEVFSVTVQVDLDYPDDRCVRPRTVEFDSLDEAQAAIGRALGLALPPGAVTVMVSREHLGSADPLAEEPELNDWPAARHVVLGAYTGRAANGRR